MIIGNRTDEAAAAFEQIVWIKRDDVKIVSNQAVIKTLSIVMQIFILVQYQLWG